MSFKLISWDDDKQHSLVSGGLIYSITMKFKFIAKKKHQLLYTAVLFSLVAWVPLLLLSIIDGTFIGNKVEINFLEDFSIHARLLVVIPFLILIEKMVDTAYDKYINSTRRRVISEEKNLFDSITKKVDRLSNSFIPEIIFLIVIYGAFFYYKVETDVSISIWNQISEGNFTITGWYLVAVGFPIYQLLIARWLWRWIIWFYSLIKFSRLELEIDATHADKMAGMEYLNIVPLTFGVLFLSSAIVFAAKIGMDITYYASTLKEYYFTILGFVVTIPLILFLPLLFFTPTIIKAKIYSINYFGSLIQYHNVLFREKWLGGKLPESESSLGSLDNSSLADINSSYQQSVSDINIIPINLKMLISIALLLLIPFLPLLLTFYSLSELISKLTSIVFG